MVLYLLVLLSVTAWKYVPRPWHPTRAVETPHLVVHSTATQEQTEDTGRVIEVLYNAYSNRLGRLAEFQRDHPKLRVKLYKDRKEFRRINPGIGWGEAFYSQPYSHAYFSADEVNHYQWMLHECAHQLNREVAHLSLAKWLDEGLAEYFSTSWRTTNELLVGRIDQNTYPVWWIDTLATTPDLVENLRNGSVIPLRAILTNRGGPNMDRHFNLYYLHWWTLTHFIFQDPRHSGRVLELAHRGGGLAAFEELIGPVDQVQTKWHIYVRRLKSALATNDVYFLKTGTFRETANVGVKR